MMESSAIPRDLVTARGNAVQPNNRSAQGVSWMVHGPQQKSHSGMSTRVLTGAERLVRCLEEQGVEYIFGLSGGAAMPIFDALVDSKIKLILTRHEQGATHMADGYARSTGRPGVVLVTSGPGATNTVTGPAHRADGFGADDRAHGPDADREPRQGRVPGSRRHRHHLPRGEAQLPRDRGRRHPARRDRGVLPRDHRPPRPGADRSAEGRDLGAVHRAAVRAARHPGLRGARARGPGGDQSGRRDAVARPSGRCSTSATAR